MKIGEEIILAVGKPKVKTVIGTQWKVKYTQRPLHSHAYVCGHTFLCKIDFPTSPRNLIDKFWIILYMRIKKNSMSVFVQFLNYNIISKEIII